jgi:hypothetical protein
MKMAEEIIVEVSPQGEVKVSVKGVKGKSCKDMTKALEAAFGDVQSSVKTSEFNETPLVSKVKVRQ